MPPRRCVVQDCDRVADKQLGISVHTSPGTGTERAMWKRFVSQHRKHFKPDGTFGICSLHFTDDCFTRSVHIKRTERRLKPGSVPSIWKKGSVSLSERTRRRVSYIRGFLFRAQYEYRTVTFMVFFLNNKHPLFNSFDNN